jgi:hypothetical protein
MGQIHYHNLLNGGDQVYEAHKKLAEEEFKMLAQQALSSEVELQKEPAPTQMAGWADYFSQARHLHDLEDRVGSTALERLGKFGPEL